MKDVELAGELSRRTSLPESTTIAVLEAMRDMVRDGAVDSRSLLSPPCPDHAVDPEDPTLVEQLIARARQHPLGLEFLLSGLLASVAIALGAHAFTVEAARRRLASEEESMETVAP